MPPLNVDPAAARPGLNVKWAPRQQDPLAHPGGPQAASAIQDPRLRAASAAPVQLRQVGDARPALWQARNARREARPEQSARPGAHQAKNHLSAPARPDGKGHSPV